MKSFRVNELSISSKHDFLMVSGFVLSTYSSPQEILKSFSLSKSFKKSLIVYFAIEFNILSIYPRVFQFDCISELENNVYTILKDYFILLHLKKIFEKDINFNKIMEIASSSRFCKFLEDAHLYSKELNCADDVWKNILQSISEKNKEFYSSHLSTLKFKLKECEVKDLELAENKLSKLMAEKTRVVVTFNSGLLELNAKCLLNFFQVRSMKSFSDTVEDTEDNRSFFGKRLLVEALYYLNSNVNDLQKFLMDPQAHPCYGALQFYHQISPIREYGNSFIVLSPDIKKMATATYGDTFNLTVSNNRMMPVRLSDSLVPLIAQFPKNLIKHCLQLGDEKSNGSDEFDYIEVQFPSGISLSDSQLISLIHYDLSENIPKISDLTKLLNSNVNISTGKNPFEVPGFLTAFELSKVAEFKMSMIKKYIYMAALHIGDTSEEYLKISFTDHFIKFDMNVTLNLPGFHQAQAAALLYLMGVRDYFSSVSAINFLENSSEDIFHYEIPLNHTVNQKGFLSDHDAYDNCYLSFTKLLNVLLKRIFSILLVSFQNDDYLLKHNKPHPVTGMGAIEEENQTKELYLGDGNSQYDIKIHYIFDSTLIEIESKDENNYQIVLNYLSNIFSSDLSISNNVILINLSLLNILEVLDEFKFPYQSCVTYDNSEIRYGNVLLAFRRDCGYTPSGGCNLNPFTKSGIRDLEFGQLKQSWSEFSKIVNFMGFTQNPKTCYFSFPSSCLEIKLDVDEFVEGSLISIPVYSIGNIDSEQIKSAQSNLNVFCKADQEEYKKIFNRSLPLRPLPSLIVYLKHCENIISYKISQMFYNISTFKITICSEVEEVIFQNQLFWKPHSEFGKIVIEGEYFYLELLKNMFKDTKHSFSKESLTLFNINPQMMINDIKFSSEKFYCNSVISKIILDNLVKDPVLYLDNLDATRKAEVLYLAFSEDKKIDIDTILNHCDESLSTLLLSKFLSTKNKLRLSLDDSNSEMLSYPIFWVFRFKLLKALMSKLYKKKWGVDKKTMLHIAVEEKNFTAVKYLCPKFISASSRDINGNTPLYYASSLNLPEIVSYLGCYMPEFFICKKIDNIIEKNPNITNPKLHLKLMSMTFFQNNKNYQKKSFCLSKVSNRKEYRDGLKKLILK